MTNDEKEWIEYLSQRFAAEKYAVPGLLRIVATSQAFQAVSAPTKVASN